MNILLTGANGFIGSAVARAALARGHHVAGLILPSEPPPESLRNAPGLTWVRGVLDDLPWEQVREFGPEACLHTAWIATPGVYLESPENERFVEWSLKFFRRAREHGVAHIVGIGTCIEYRLLDEPLSEASTPIAPVSLYARCKNALRLALEEESVRHGFTACWGRVFYPYGPGEHPSRLCSSVLERLARNEVISLKTPHSTKDYIYISDLAQAILTVVESRFSGPINLGTGTGVSVKELASILGQLAGKPQLIQQMNPPAIDPLGNVVADASRLRALGWKPEHDIRTGLQALHQWWTNRPQT